MDTIFLWIGVVTFILLTGVCAVISVLALIFSGFSLYGGGTRRASDWIIPMFFTALCFFLALCCINGLTPHPLSITVGIHTR